MLEVIYIYYVVLIIGCLNMSWIIVIIGDALVCIVESLGGFIYINNYKLLRNVES